MSNVPEMKITQVFKVDFIVNGRPAPVYAIGSTESEAIENAKTFWEKETAKLSKLYKSESRDAAIERVASTASRNLGKIWVINRATKERKRVEASEVEALVANGWVKGGPRTKI